MTRIIAGAAGGRRLRVPPVGTRPTTDRVRESLFSMLQSRLSGDWSSQHVLDLFAGSGALGLEALSRGAASATFVESSSKSAVVVRENLRTVGLPGGTVVASTVERYLSGQPQGRFTMVLADPPYDVEESTVRRITAQLAAGWLQPNALVVFERPRRQAAGELGEEFAEVSSRTYGETLIRVARYCGQQT